MSEQLEEEFDPEQLSETGLIIKAVCMAVTQITGAQLPFVFMLKNGDTINVGGAGMMDNLDAREFVLALEKAFETIEEINDPDRPEKLN